MERITITIDDELLRQVDGKVDNVGIKNRSHSIDLLLRKALRGYEISKAVILAGGKPERLLAPDGRTIKPLIEFDGKALIETLILLFKRNGINDFIVVVGFNGEKIVSRLKNGSDLGVNISYAWEEESLGTGGALSLARDYIQKTFILCYSDIMLPKLDLHDMLKMHFEKEAVCTLVLANSPKPLDFGVATLMGNKILSFSEKPQKTSSYLVNAGIAICEPSIFSFLKKIPCSFEKDLLPRLAQKEKLLGYVYSGEWKSI